MKVVIVRIQLTQFLNPIHCALRCGIGGGWVVGTFGRAWVLEGAVCKCAYGDFMGRGKLFLQPSSTGIAATGDFFLSSSFLIHSFFFFRTQHLQIDEDFAACLHLLEKSSSIQELLYGSNFSLAVSLVVWDLVADVPSETPRPSCRPTCSPQPELERLLRGSILWKIAWHFLSFFNIRLMQYVEGYLQKKKIRPCLVLYK